MNIKRFNRTKTIEPEVGDYVVVNYSKKSKIGELLGKSIGQITDHTNYKLYRVKYGTTD